MKVVVVGGINLDLQGVPAGKWRPGDSNPGTVEGVPGGVARNIAENLARLGARVELVAAVGTDPESGMLVDACREAGIGVDGFLRVEGARCPRYVCIFDGKGGLVGAIADMDVMSALDPAALEARSGLFDGADAIIADANLSGPALRWIADRYGRVAGDRPGESPQKHAGKASADAHGKAPGKRRPLLALDTVSCAKAVKVSGFLGAFDLVKPNLDEAAMLAGITRPLAKSGESAALVADALASAGSMPGTLFVSLGEAGMYCRDGSGGEELVSLPPEDERPRVRNRSGAGDAACAALAWATLRGSGLRERGACALAAAMLAASSDETVFRGMDEGLVLDLSETVLRHSHGATSSFRDHTSGIERKQP